MNNALTIEPEEEQSILSLPQVDVEVNHHFGPGVYIREMVMEPGLLVLGHEHKFPHLCQVLTGTLLIKNDTGSVKKVTGPYMFVSQPGRKILQAVDRVIFCNVLPNPNNETDIEKLDSVFVEKSQVWRDFKKLTQDCNAVVIDHPVDIGNGAI